MPLLLLGIFGSGLDNIVEDLGDGVRYTDFIFPGILVMSIMMTAFAAGMSLVWDREFGFLKVLLVAPVSRTGITLGKTLGGATIALVQSLIVLALAPLFDIPLTVVSAAKAVPFLILVALAIGGLGTLIASRVRSLQAFHVLSELLLIPFIFLSGAFFPVNEVPTWLGVLAKLNFVTYAADGIRHVVLPDLGASSGKDLGVTVFGHTVGLWTDTIVIGVVALLTLSLATWALSRRG